MKAKQRHELKQNEFAATTGRVVDIVNENRSRAGIMLIALVVVGGLALGVLYWRKYVADQAGALLGIAMATSQATIAPPSTLPGAAQQAGTFPTERARGEAALKAYQAVVDQRPSSDAAAVASYQAGAELLELGRAADAEQAFRKIAAASSSALYKPLAKLGLAQALLAQGKNEDAVKAFSDLAAERDSSLPVDGLLMQLGQACLKAGKPQDARAAFKRVADEFPDSSYVTDAKQQVAAIN